jgi:flagella basal body P-ring formation protein FlgA
MCQLLESLAAKGFRQPADKVSNGESAASCHVCGNSLQAWNDWHDICSLLCMQRKQHSSVRNLTLGSLLLVSATMAGVPEWQPNADISATAEAYVRGMSGGAGGKTAVQAATLDPRHHLPRCDRDLSAFVRPGTRVQARTIVGVRCTGSKPWKVYIAVDVVTMATVYVARATLPKGHLLTAADLATDERDVSRMTGGYLTSPEALIGQRLKQQLTAGRIITPQVLQADNIIRRGQSVTLTATAGGINVTMSGKSLMDGALNQRIRAENLSSGRVIEGIVRSREHVEILLPESSNYFHAKPKGLPATADTQVSNNDR